MHSTHLHPSPVKDGRRVLGNRTTNACLLSPAANRNVDAFISLKSPTTKQALFQDTSFFRKVAPVSTPAPVTCHAGQKRSIDRVEGNEDASGAASCQKQSRQEDIRPRMGTTAVPEDPETRKAFIQDKASLLRNRIQRAMHHVKDHQFDRRLSDLEAHSRKFPRLSFLSATPTHRREPTIKKTTTTTTTPPSENTPRPDPALEHNKPALRTTSPHHSGLSSPPLSAGNNRDEQVRTPTQRDFRRRHSDPAESPMQLSSPPATVQRGGCDRQRMGESRTERGSDSATATAAEKQTAPTQKGDAVNGLLKLMTVDKHEQRPFGALTS